jgi:hypothetical protein
MLFYIYINEALNTYIRSAVSVTQLNDNSQ